MANIVSLVLDPNRVVFLDDIVAAKLSRNRSHAAEIIIEKVEKDEKLQHIIFGRKVG